MGGFSRDEVKVIEFSGGDFGVNYGTRRGILHGVPIIHEDFQISFFIEK